jgi:S-adenosylmethionine hydrolase
MKNHINLITDFGATDHYAGVMSAVILSINSDARIVSTTHQVPPHCVETAAFLLLESFPYWSANSIHVVVVDPEVGGERHPLAFKVGGQVVIGPDNGFIGYLASRYEISECRIISNAQWMRPEISSTFHGRDIFAPAAAHLSLGLPFSKIGQKIEKYRKLDLPRCDAGGNRVAGRIIHIDHFGNAISNVSKEVVDALGGRGSLISEINGHQVKSLTKNFCSASNGELSMMLSSGGWLEFVSNRSSAAANFSLKIGTPFVVEAV